MSTRPLRPCLEPRCPNYVAHGRCTEHQRTHARQRGTTEQRGFGSAWQQARKHRSRTRPPVACECCRVVTKLILDHNHSTNALRGWLCTSCNTSIGLIENGRAQPTQEQAAYLHAWNELPGGAAREKGPHAP